MRPGVLVGCVSFPLALALSPREREHRIPGSDKSTRSGLAKARRAILPLPKGEGRGEGEATLETPMRLRPSAPHPSKSAVSCGLRSKSGLLLDRPSGENSNHRSLSTQLRNV